MSDAATEAAEPLTVGVGQAGGQEGYTFRFVEVGEPSQDRDEDARSVIRSHVMRDFYEKKDGRRRPSTLPVLTPTAPKDAGPPRTRRFKFGPQGLQELKKRRKKSGNVSQQAGRTFSVASKNHAAKDVGARSPASKFMPPKTSSGLFNGPSISQIYESITRNSEWSAAEVPQTTFSAQSARIILRPGLQLFGSGLVDPFNTLPPSSCPRTQRLLYYGMYHPTTLLL